MLLRRYWSCSRHTALHSQALYCRSRYYTKSEHLAMDTSQRVASLRKLMQDNGVTAYVVDSGDAHYSEYVADTDKRRVSV